MSDKSSQFHDKSSRNQNHRRTMNSTAFCRDAIIAAGTPHAGVSDMIRRAARVLDLPACRVKGFWHQTAKPSGDELWTIHARLAALAQQDDELTRQHAEIRARLAAGVFAAPVGVARKAGAVVGDASSPVDGRVK